MKKGLFDFKLKFDEEKIIDEKMDNKKLCNILKELGDKFQ